MTDVERLARVDRLDRERARLQGEIGKLRAALAEAEGALTAAAATLAEATARLEASRAAERAAGRRIEELRQKRASAMRVLETGAGNADAAQRQVENCDGLIDAAETEMLELLEAQDGVRATLAAAEGTHRAAEQALADARASHPARLAQLSAEAEAVGREVEAALAELPAEQRKRYGALRASGRWPVATVKDGDCAACRMAVPPQKVADLRKGRVEECNGCHRWLVPPE